MGQAACPESVFDVLKDYLGVTHELFASPLNCFFASYCSAFADTDAPFGSCGSFWTFDPLRHLSGSSALPRGGSYQANPPFVPSIMDAMVDRIHALLDASAIVPSHPRHSTLSSNTPPVPLSFTVVVPGWLEDAAYQKLCRSEQLRAKWIIAKNDHGFCDGAQHQRRDRFRESPFDTVVFVLQNDAGNARWAPSLECEEQLRLAFATGFPTHAASERRLKAGRGFADQDGGGGVYKGRKRGRDASKKQGRDQTEKADI